MEAWQSNFSRGVETIIPHMSQAGEVYNVPPTLFRPFISARRHADKYEVKVRRYSRDLSRKCLTACRDLAKQSVFQQPNSFRCSIQFAFHAKRMQKWGCKASPCSTDERGTADVIGGVWYVMVVRVRLRQAGMWRSTDRRDPSPACFTTERHCRWEGRVRRGLRARRHTHTPPDRDTRSRWGRQPLRTPRGGLTALQEGQATIHSDSIISVIRNFLHFILSPTSQV